MSERATFSPFWHRVRLLRPRLRPHVQVTRQHYRGRRWHVVHDPASNQFYRLNPIAHEFVGMLDGQRDVETAWKAALQKFGDAAPTQNEVIQLIGQLYSANLLSGDVPPETEQLLRRGRERLKKKIQQQAIGIMYFRIRLFNPDRIFAAIEPVLRPLLNRWGLLLWGAFVLFSLSRLLPHWKELAASFDQLTQSPEAWAWLGVVWVVLKAIHETGHGVICKRFGGQVPELGVMLLVLFPSPYVDASSTWAFASKWRRAAVGAGGMIFELFCAAVASWVWLGARDPLVKQVAYNAMLTASISTVFFNANPLMRFDGYYILADLLETPNLAQRSNQYLKYLVQKYVYRLERPSATLPSTLPGERAILLAYGVLAMAYRVFLFITITLFVMGKLFAIGLVLAIWTAAAWFIVPVGALVHWLASSPALTDRRGRTVAMTAAMAAAGLLAVGVVPMPDRRRAYGVLESESRAGVYTGVDGFVVQVHRRPGEAVGAGEPILTMESPELRQERRRIAAMIEENLAEERRALKDMQPAAAQVARDRVAVLRRNLDEIDRRLGELVVRSPIDGVVVRADPARMLGGYVRRGEAVCEVVNPGTIRIAAVVGQSDADWLFDRPTLVPEQGAGTPATGDFTVEARLVARALDRPIAGGVVRVLTGRPELPSAALGFAGGGKVETDPRDRTGTTAKRPTFTVFVAPAPIDGQAAGPIGSPGERVKLRFTLPSKPLMAQWLDRLNKTIQGRINV
jgi:putative peptide zinc metalloprotease protein